MKFVQDMLEVNLNGLNNNTWQKLKIVFLRSKMNKDLDDRLIPNGEYRDAQNISVGKSEDDDVGALENILGNTVLDGSGKSFVGTELII